MKRILFILLLFIWTTIAHAETVSRQDAVNFVMAQYDHPEQMAYYATMVTSVETDTICCFVTSGTLSAYSWLTSGAPMWLIFVDEVPLADWCHQCSYYYISPTTDADTIKYCVFQGQLPPNVDFEYSLVPPANNEENEMVDFFDQAPIEINDSAANRIHAVLFNGGYNPRNNYKRYWNNLAYIYSTLTYDYGIPKSNITILSAGGTNSANDTNISSFDTPSLYKQNLDLDGDGHDDIAYDGSRNSFLSVMDSLSSCLTNSDHLFIYVTDHGSSLDKESNSLLCSWYGYINKTDFSNALNNFTNIGSINVVMGQCYSGGFVDAIEGPGRIVMTSCAGNEVSYSSGGPNGKGRFLSFFTDAIAGLLVEDGINLADVDDNGIVSMKEAFDIARQKVIEHYASTSIIQTPLYSSITPATGDDWAFNHVLQPVSLYVKDNVNDSGKEYNTTATHSNSPEIWLRKRGNLTLSTLSSPMGLLIDFFRAGDTAYTYVRVRNRGHQNYNGQGKYLHCYWSESASALINAWNGNNDSILGGYVGSVPITATINSGFSGLTKIQWQFPSSLYQKYSSGLLTNPEIALLVIINDSPIIDLADYSSNNSILPLQHNNIATMTVQFNVLNNSNTQQGIQNIEVLGNSGILNVSLQNEASNNASFLITSTSSPTYSTQSVHPGTKELEIDLNSIPSGPCVISYIEDGVLIESRKIIK